jgi:beta-lactamase class A
LFSRRGLLTQGLLIASAMGSVTGLAQSDASDIQTGVADLESVHGGRLGVCVVDVATGRRIEHRANERFAMSSTYKFLAAAFVLMRVERGEDTLGRRIHYSKDVLVPYSPVTQQHVGDDGMTLGELCEAAMTQSDNTAGNLILESFGGPPQFTRFARLLGDDVTRLDRVEPDVNEATPGDPRDTTTPGAMADNVRKIVLGDGLSPLSRDQLSTWMVANKTGDKRLRAGIPGGWRVGDKTGSGGYGDTNDIAVIWPPDRDPIIVTAYFAGSSATSDVREMVLADVARLAVGAMVSR